MRKKCSCSGVAAPTMSAVGSKMVPAPAAPSLIKLRRDKGLMARALPVKQKAWVHGDRQCHGGDRLVGGLLRILAQEEVAPGDELVVRCAIAHHSRPEIQ